MVKKSSFFHLKHTLLEKIYFFVEEVIVLV